MYIYIYVERDIQRERCIYIYGEKEMYVYIYTYIYIYDRTLSRRGSVAAHFSSLGRCAGHRMPGGLGTWLHPHAGRWAAHYYAGETLEDKRVTGKTRAL